MFLSLRGDMYNAHGLGFLRIRVDDIYWGHIYKDETRCDT